MLLLCCFLGMSPFSLARPTKCSVPSTHTHTSPSLSPSSYSCVCREQGRVGGRLPAALFHVLVYSLWLGRGWPGLGLLVPTPLDPSRHRHQNGTVEHTQTRALKQTWLLLLTISVTLACLLTCIILGTYRQHQHGTRGPGQTVSTRQTSTTRRTLQHTRDKSQNKSKSTEITRILRKHIKVMKM